MSSLLATTLPPLCLTGLLNPTSLPLGDQAAPYCEGLPESAWSVTLPLAPFLPCPRPWLCCQLGNSAPVHFPCTLNKNGVTREPSCRWHFLTVIKQSLQIKTATTGHCEGVCGSLQQNPVSSQNECVIKVQKGAVSKFWAFSGKPIIHQPA